MDNADRKDQPAKQGSKVEDLERVVRVRKYRHCAAEYLTLAKEPKTMPEVRARYLRIAEHYLELAETEATKAGEVKLMDATPRPGSQARGVTHGDQETKLAVADRSMSTAQAS